MHSHLEREECQQLQEAPKSTGSTGQALGCHNPCPIGDDTHVQPLNPGLLHNSNVVEQIGRSACRLQSASCEVDQDTRHQHQLDLISYRTRPDSHLFLSVPLAARNGAEARMRP
jgi:hypothetical protein